ncbi:hypothetical protein LO771_12595 [Streptacidiphilus sp. ASG 303]|uniref:non-homologous end-joining DNA ligase LigD n=1 Tax=Streptacidiphilus sp. ASG 303 TaxID=2896847 RepID=UPI001E2E9C6A|nr:hypothetical protein [Streptacidiphilus sp. ASG 303]MCD0483222.1 hypothetical protein [Streptacidiphilus sp. ASG 303]
MGRDGGPDAPELRADGRTVAYARAVAELLERRHPGLVVSRTDRSLRGGRVLVDWARNNAARTTVAPCSLRARALPTVSTPLAWDEVEACREAEELRFTAPDVLERAERRGDPMAEVPGTRQRLPRAPAAAS